MKIKLQLGVICAIILLVFQAQAARPSLTIQTSAGPVKITPIYHASALIQAGSKSIYIDPARPLPRPQPSAPSYFTGLPAADLILITHTHPDHLDPVIIAKLSKPGTKIIAPAAVAKTVTAAKVISNGQTTTWDGWTIHAVAMYNLKRGPAPGKLYHPKDLGNGYVLTYGGKRIYFSGGTENTPELRALKNIDVAFVCMNLPFTMPPAESAAAVRAFHPKIAIPYHYRSHYGTSNLNDFKNDLKGAGIKVRIFNWYSKQP
ncbi:MAG: MBL fold metallo-hydrolase [Terriglobia bacterium]